MHEEKTENLVIVIYSLAGGAGVVALNLAKAAKENYGNVEIHTRKIDARLLEEKCCSLISVREINSDRYLDFCGKSLGMIKLKNSKILVFGSPIYAVFKFLSFLKSPILVRRMIFLRETTATRYVFGSMKPFKRFVLSFLFRAMAITTPLIIANSRGTKNSLCDFLFVKNKNIKVIYNPVYTCSQYKVLSSSNRDVELDVNRPIKVLSVGRLSWQKGFDILIEAIYIARVTSSFDIFLDIYGDGKERAQLEYLIEKFELKGIVNLKGYEPNIHRVYQNYSVFVLSSRYEGFGNVLAEALSSGIRIVSIDCKSGPAEILENGKYGRLVNQHSAKILASHLVEEIISETSDVSMRRARGRVFCSEQIVPLYLRCLEDVY